MKIEVFGSGCCSCNDLYQLVQEVVAEKGLNAELIKVSDIKEIVQRGIMRTPALAVNGKIVCSGRIPKKDEIANWLIG